MAALEHLLRNLRTRHLVRAGLIYLGVAWGLTEATAFLIDNYGVSRKLLDVVLLLLMLGLPVALVIAWNHGEQGRQEVTRTEVLILTLFLVLAGVGTYRIGVGEEVPQPEGGAPVADLGSSSVAVLPFTNNTGADSLDWIGPGFSDLLTSNLAQEGDLSVVSPQRLFALLREQGREETEQIPDQFAIQIASRSGANIMARGSILGSADDLRIDVQLIDLGDGTVIGADRARGSDLFALADTLSSKVVERLLGHPVSREPVIRSPLALTGDLDAYRKYQTDLRARWGDLDPGDIGELYRLADVYETAGGRDEERREILRQILALDSLSTRAYLGLAEIAAQSGDLAVADSLIDRYQALDSDPGAVDRSLGRFYEETGRFEMAREHYLAADEVEEAPALDLFVRAFLRESRPGEARAALDPYVQSNATELRAEARLLTGDTYAWEGRFAEARESYREAADLASAANQPALRSVALKSAHNLEELLTSDAPVIFNPSIWRLLDLGKGERALDVVDAAHELQMRHVDRLVPVEYHVLQYARGRALELVGWPAPALRLYEELVEHWGDALAQVPLMRDLPDRIENLSRAP